MPNKLSSRNVENTSLNGFAYIKLLNSLKETFNNIILFVPIKIAILRF